MFFSTPHLGMEERAWPLFARHVLQLDAPAKRACPTKAMLKELRLNSEGLYRLTEDFAHLRDQLAFVTFIESKPMRGLKRTVSEFLLWLPFLANSELYGTDTVSWSTK